MKSDWHKYLLFLVALVSGAVLLLLEFVAQRMLATVWGSGLEVWGADIAVALGSLAVGYALGGRLADRYPTPWTLLFSVSAGALCMAVTSLFGTAWLEFIGQYFPGSKSGSLIGATAVLGPASILLAMTTPIIVRLITVDMVKTGAVSGNVYAIGTIGSIIGAIATTFYLVQEFSLNALLAGASALLLLSLLPLIMTIDKHQRVALTTGLGLVTATGVLAGSLQAAQLRPGDKTITGSTVVYAAQTKYHNLLVEDKDGIRSLLLNGVHQSDLNLQKPNEVIYQYMQSLMRGYCPVRKVDDIVLIGAGAGTFVRASNLLFPNADITAVDIDEQVLTVAQNYFSAPTGPTIKYVHEDGREYLKGIKPESADLLVMDAFSGATIPSHLTTQEFFQIVESRLRPGGVLMMNLIASQKSELTAALIATLKTQFPSVELSQGATDTLSPSSSTNLIIRASKKPMFPSTDCYREIEERLEMEPETLSQYRTLRAPGDGRVLTDDYAPADQLR